MLILVVDDLLVAYSNKHRTIYNAFILKFKQDNEIKQFAASSYVGLEIIRDRKTRTMKVTQHAAIENLLKEHRFIECTPEPLPAAKNTRLSLADCPKDCSPELELMKKFPYRHIFGVLHSISVMTRPDISFIINSLARFGPNLR